jgi:hypothetical protein
MPAFFLMPAEVAVHVCGPYKGAELLQKVWCALVFGCLAFAVGCGGGSGSTPGQTQSSSGDTTWSATAAYSAGDVVKYNGETYTALVPHLLGPGINWTPASSPTLWSKGGTYAGPIAPKTTPYPAPPPTWQEHWFEHNQNLRLIVYNDTVAVYFDNDVNTEAGKWILPYLTKMWQYTQNTYGGAAKTLSTDRLYSITHEGKYYGGHPSYYYDPSHDYRNVIDVGGDNWMTPQYELMTHEAGHIVESVASGKYGSPAFPLWGDSKWMEFYIYDVYSGLGMTTEAQDFYNRMMAPDHVDDFPVPNTHWFRDWFYPLWRDHNKAQVMANYFRLMGQYYPTNGQYFAHDQNWGEFVHFMSGAAGVDLRPQAQTAFGWPAEWESEYEQAKQDFPEITY